MTVLPAMAVDSDTLAVDKVDTVAATTDADNSDWRVKRYRKSWEALIPTQHIWQYAGNMGFLSAGIGWDYGRHKQWETNLLFGYLPKYSSGRSKITMTLKQTYIPWSFRTSDLFAFEPLSCGVYFNTVFGSEFWNNEPARYPDDYYPFLSTKLRVNVFVGQRLELIIPQNRRKLVKSMTFFYELSACDLHLRALIQDSSVKLNDVLSLSLGVKFQLL